MFFQREYWEKTKDRRSPDHPMVREYCRPMLTLFRRHRDVYLRRRELKPTLLDLGSGNAYFSYELREEFDIAVLDYSSYMLSINPFKKKIQADITHLPVRSDSIDVVLCANTLHHVVDVDQCIREMKRVARDCVFFIEPNGLSPFIRFQSLVMPQERQARRFTRNYLRKKIEGAGLCIVVEKSTGIILPKRFPLWSLPFFRLINVDAKYALYNVFLTAKDSGRR
jgi:SAM-dependent methyltransferase